MIFYIYLSICQHSYSGGWSAYSGSIWCPRLLGTCLCKSDAKLFHQSTVAQPGLLNWRGGSRGQGCPQGGQAYTRAQRAGTMSTGDLGDTQSLQQLTHFRQHQVSAVPCVTFLTNALKLQNDPILISYCKYQGRPFLFMPEGLLSLQSICLRCTLKKRKHLRNLENRLFLLRKFYFQENT